MLENQFRIGKMTIFLNVELVQSLAIVAGFLPGILKNIVTI
jgi:hypothetical protein